MAIQISPARINLVAFRSGGTIAMVSSGGNVYLWRPNYTITPGQKEKAYKIFIEKGLYGILMNIPQEDSQ